MQAASWPLALDFELYDSTIYDRAEEGSRLDGSTEKTLQFLYDKATRPGPNCLTARRRGSPPEANAQGNATEAKAKAKAKGSG